MKYALGGLTKLGCRGSGELGLVAAPPGAHVPLAANPLSTLRHPARIVCNTYCVLAGSETSQFFFHGVDMPAEVPGLTGCFTKSKYPAATTVSRCQPCSRALICDSAFLFSILCAWNALVYPNDREDSIASPRICIVEMLLYRWWWRTPTDGALYG